MLALKNIHHVAILTGSALYGTCKDFYTRILGFGILAETYRAERDSYKLDLTVNGQYQIELFSFPDYKERASFPEAKGLRHLAFGVENVSAAANWLVSQGVIVEPIRIDALTGKQFLFFNDPNGQPLELYEL